MADKDLAERIGRTINELDIDFSSFTVVGWLISAVSLAIGGGAGYGAYRFVPDANGRNEGPALAFGLTMIAVTVCGFIALRFVAGRFGIRVTRSKPPRATPVDSERLSDGD